MQKTLTIWGAVIIVTFIVLGTVTGLTGYWISGIAHFLFGLLWKLFKIFGLIAIGIMIGYGYATSDDKSEESHKA